MNWVFDLDDTLYDLSEPFRRSHTDLFKEQLGEDCEELFRMSRVYSDQVLEMEKEGKVDPKDAFYLRIRRCYQDVGMDMSRETADAFEEKYRYYQKHITVPETIQAMLDFCKDADHQLAVLSNGKIKGQFVKVNALNLYRWFDEKNIFISDMTGYHKPAIQVFEYVQQYLQAEPETIWYVGDTYEVDVAGGKNAGWNVIWFNHRHRKVPESCNRANITVTTAEELLEVIRQLTSEAKNKAYTNIR